MNKGILTVGIIFLALIALLLLQVLNNYSTGSELDYYLVKETVDSAMEDSLDDVYYRTCGVYRMDKEKFVESFLYRFANSVDTKRNYTVSFYDLNEVPPKASVQVDSSTVLAVNNKNTNQKDVGYITTSYDGILETNYRGDLAVEYGLNTDSDLCKSMEDLAS